MLTLLMQFLSGEGNALMIIEHIFVLVFVTVCCLPVHECAHAWMAEKLGDPTGRLKGRISLNPMDHLSLMGTVMLFVFGFGYAKPVPVNPRRFKNPKAGMALTALAGPLSNVLMAFVFMMLRGVSTILYVRTELLFADVAQSFFFFAAQINISLAVYNLIPIPPLDGSRIINLIIPSKYYFKIYI